MSHSDIQHSLNMLSGLEAFSNGNVRSPDAVYAASVLRLHALDAGNIEGSEGFMDAIKKGAKNVKDWIIALIKALKEYLTNTDRKIAQQRKQVSDLGKTIDDNKKKAKAENKVGEYAGGWINDPKLGDFSKSIESIISDLEGIDGVKATPVQWEPDLSKALTGLKALLKASEDSKTDPIAFGEKITECTKAVDGQMTNFVAALNKWRSGFDEKELGAVKMGPDFHKAMTEINDASRRLVKMTDAMIKRCEDEAEFDFMKGGDKKEEK